MRYCIPSAFSGHLCGACYQRILRYTSTSCLQCFKKKFSYEGCCFTSFLLLETHMNNVTRIFQELKSEPDKSNHAQECGPKLASILFSRGSLASSLFSQVQKSPVYGTACISCYGTYHIMTAVRSLFLSASWEKLCSHHPHTQKDCFLKVFRFFVGPDSTVGSHRLVCTTQAATESTMKNLQLWPNSFRLNLLLTARQLKAVLCRWGSQCQNAYKQN